MTPWRTEREFHRGVNTIFGILYALVIAEGLAVIGRNIPIFSKNWNAADLGASLFFTVFMVVLAIEITRAKEIDSHYVEGRGRYGALFIYGMWIGQYSLHYGFIQSVGNLPVGDTLPRYMLFVLVLFCLYVICDLLIIGKSPLHRISGYSKRPIWVILFYGCSSVVLYSEQILGYLGYVFSLPIIPACGIWLMCYLLLTWKSSLGE